jgi:hypothetical protein
MKQPELKSEYVFFINVSGCRAANPEALLAFLPGRAPHQVGRPAIAPVHGTGKERDEQGNRLENSD